MAAFSYQYHHPVDASLLMDQPAALPPSQFHPPQRLQETSSNVTNYQEPISDSEPSFVTKNQSPETSMVVDNVETGHQVAQKVIPMFKKRRSKNASSFSSPQSSKDTGEGRKKKQKKNNGGLEEEEEKKKADKKGAEEPPTGYIHVRARRGQATDSHSLAERVRREKISERMKTLQRLVPGCDKVTGKALMLDEIINYVQSLQYQVEFLSMKLASVNPIVYDFTTDLDTLMIKPEKLNNMASAVPTLPQCSPSQATTFVDTTIVTTATSLFPTGTTNIEYLVNDSASFLPQQGQRSNVFSEDSGNHIWDVEEQRQKFLGPYGFGNNLCSFN